MFASIESRRTLQIKRDHSERAIARLHHTAKTSPYPQTRDWAARKLETERGELARLIALGAPHFSEKVES